MKSLIAAMQKPLKSLDLWKHRLWVRVAESVAIYVINAVSMVGLERVASAAQLKKDHKMLVPDQTKNIKPEEIHDANLCEDCIVEDCDCEE
jgi:hypothetical protein